MNAASPVISAFYRVPEFAQGRVRDLRLRWAFEEVGAPYETHLLDAMSPRDADYVGWQPFDQVPAYRDGEVAMFESGAILLRIAQAHEALLPREESERWQAISWLFAALNSVEPPLMMLATITLFHGDQPWAGDASTAITPLARQRLKRLDDALAGKDWLAGTFSIADIAMVTVLANDPARLVEERPLLAAYCARARERAAYQRALRSQVSDFSEVFSFNPTTAP